MIRDSYRPPLSLLPHSLKPRSGPLRLGFIGRIHPSKGVELLLSEIGRLPLGKWNLLIAGSGEPLYVDEIRRTFPNPSVSFGGWMSTADFFSQIDVLVVPALWEEPLGRVIYESYAHGIPVVAARRGGIPEIVDIGITGWLFEPDTPGDLVRQLQEIVAQPESARILGESCREKARLFLPELCASAYRSVYESRLPNRLS